MAIIDVMEENQGERRIGSGGGGVMNKEIDPRQCLTFVYPQRNRSKGGECVPKCYCVIKVSFREGIHEQGS